MDTDRSRLFNLIYGYIGTHLISAACKIDLFDAIGDQACSSTELASRLGCDESHLRRLMKALSSYGLMTWEPPSTFSATAMGALLAKSTPDSFYPAVETGFDGLTRDTAWHALPQALRSGGVPFDIGLGERFFSYLERHPAYQKTFYDAMESSLTKVIEVAQLIDFGRFRSVLDIGGANGTLLSAIRARFPALDCSVFDREALTVAGDAGASAALASAGLGFISGDFFETIPGGFDCYVLSRILDDWNDKQAAVILRNVRLACEAGRSLFVMQPITSSVDGSFDATLADINMLVYMGGTKRSADGIGQLARAAGFTFAKTYRLPKGRHVALEFIAQ